MSLRKGISRLLLIFVMGIWVLAGCNQFASMDENVDLDERGGEKADDLTEEKISEEGEWFSTPEEVSTLGLREDMLA